MSVYDYTMKTAQGEEVSLAQYKGDTSGEKPED